jgi:hypothetical protein
LYVHFEQVSSILHFSGTNSSLSFQIHGLNLVLSIRSISAATVQTTISHEIDIIRNILIGSLEEYNPCYREEPYKQWTDARGLARLQYKWVKIHSNIAVEIYHKIIIL